MIIDEPAFWNLIPPRQRARVELAAKAMCRTRDADEDIDGEAADHCRGCDTPAGGSCVAFGLYGAMALAVVQALDQPPTRSARA